MAERKNPIKLTDTTLRDAHQSLIATRLSIQDIIPVMEKLDRVGFHSLEVWGGANFDSCIRFLNEDPWERLRTIRKYCKKTKLQMLLRGQNIVGYHHYPDDVVERFVVKAVANGLDIIRIFDALNDVRNMELAIKVAKREGAHVQGSVCYTVSPVHDINHFVKVSRELSRLEADSICIKDMAGLLSPIVASKLVKRLKKELKIPIQLHSHYTSGMASMAYQKAIDAGVDIIDTALSPFSCSTSHPASESIVTAYSGTSRDTGLDLDLLFQISQHFRKVREKYSAYETGLKGVDAAVLRFQVPGGMISNLEEQLKRQNALNKYYAVLEEVPRVRKELGYPPLVTPSSQIVGTQAVLNVILGQRYKMVPKEVKEYVRGMYGRPPAPIDKKIKQICIGDEEPIKGRPADSIPAGFPTIPPNVKSLARNEEDLLTYLLFPKTALSFFRTRERQIGEKTVLEGDAFIAGIAALANSLFNHQKRLKYEIKTKPQTSSNWQLAARQEMLKNSL